jgi:threonyl-tRNA synthetase
MKEETTMSNIELMRHSFSHILAMASVRLFKNVKLGIGPAVDDGFYHDFQFPNPIGQDELRLIENEIKKIIEEELPFQKITVTKENAFDILHMQGQIFKTEILAQLRDNEVTFYKTGQEFMDLCRGPHVEHTGKLGAFKLTGISGVYWNGDETRPAMQRIHGIAFTTQEELENYIKNKAELANRDHRKIGQQMEFFTFLPEAGGGLPIWLPKGKKVKEIIEGYLGEQNVKLGSQYIESPLITRINPTLKTSTPSQSFPSFVLDGDEYFLSSNPNNFFLELYITKKRSYRSLPFKLSETKKVFRYEKSGELNGMTKVREFNLDSNIVISTKEGLMEDIETTLRSIYNTYSIFGLNDVRTELSIPSQNWTWETSQKDWLKCQNTLIEAGKKAQLLIHESPGTAIKTGPSINFIFKDVRGRDWKLGYLIIDTQVVDEWKLSYVNAKNKKSKPNVFYWSTIGSIERFFGLITENFAGAFPLWLSPVTVSIIPISEKFNDYAREVYNYLIQNKISTEINTSSDTMQNKIRESQKQMVPYMLVIGEKEALTQTISVRPRSGQDLGIMKIDHFIDNVRKEIFDKVNF